MHTHTFPNFLVLYLIIHLRQSHFAAFPAIQRSGGELWRKRMKSFGEVALWNGNVCPPYDGVGNWYKFQHCCRDEICVWAELVWSAMLDGSGEIRLRCFPGARWWLHLTAGIHPAMDWWHIHMLLHTQGQLQVANPLICTQTVTRAQDRVNRAVRQQHYLLLHPAAPIHIWWDWNRQHPHFRSHFV